MPRLIGSLSSSSPAPAAASSSRVSEISHVPSIDVVATASPVSPSIASAGGGQRWLNTLADGLSSDSRHGLTMKLTGEISPATAVSVNVSR